MTGASAPSSTSEWVSHLNQRWVLARSRQQRVASDNFVGGHRVSTLVRVASGLVRVVVVVAAGVLATACISSSSEPQARPTTSAPTGTPTPSPTETAMPEPGEQARLDARLIAAAWEDDVELAARLIERGADVNAQDDTQQSAFLIAASEGYVDLLDLTMTHGADLESKDSSTAPR